MKIFILGNPDLEGDDIAVRLMPRLKKQFPEIEFKHIDPLEGFGGDLNAQDEKIVIIDAVQGISKVRRFDDLEQFVSAHRKLTMHDFDLYDELILLQKLKKLPKIAIIGIPWRTKEKNVWDDLISTIEYIRPLTRIA